MEITQINIVDFFRVVTALCITVEIQIQNYDMLVYVHIHVISFLIRFFFVSI